MGIDFGVVTDLSADRPLQVTSQGMRVVDAQRCIDLDIQADGQAPADALDSKAVDCSPPVRRDDAHLRLDGFVGNGSRLRLDGDLGPWYALMNRTDHFLLYGGDAPKR